MVADMFLGKPKQKKIVKDSNLKKDLVSFVSKQFSELLKKNLRVPIKLYQL